MTHRLTIELNRASKLWPADLKPLARRVLAAARTAIPEKLSGSAEISVLLGADSDQRALNSAFRGMAKPTNVLSFPALDAGAPVEGFLGDISLAYQTVRREAATAGIPFRHHFAHLLAHGFLHILGYDHQRDEEAGRMEALETAILAKLKISDPYAPAPRAKPRGSISKSRRKGRRTGKR